MAIAAWAWSPAWRSAWAASPCITREGYRVRGRWFGFLLFLLLENPGKVYAGLIAGLAVGIFLPDSVTPTEQESTLNQSLLVFGPLAGGAALGLVFWFFRRVRAIKIRKWLGLGLAVVFIAAAAALFFFYAGSTAFVRPARGSVQASSCLLGIPGFYVLTFASLVEESEVEIAAICGAMDGPVAHPQLLG